MSTDKQVPLDWLAALGFATITDSRIEKFPGVHCWRHEGIQWMWTAHWISSEFKTAREAIDAALRAKQEPPQALPPAEGSAKDATGLLGGKP